MRIKLLFCLIMCLFSIQGFAYQTINLSAYQYQDRQYYWKTNQDAHLTSIKLYYQNQPTEIQYSWADGIRAANSSADATFNVIAPKPGRTLWSPHPTSVQTLEEVFLNALQAVGYPAIQVPYLVENQYGLQVSDVSDFLKQYRQMPRPTTATQFLKSLQGRMNETSNELIFNNDTDKRLIPTFLNIVEPIKSATRYDAFSLFPLKAYLKYKDIFIAELERWSNIAQLNALDSFQYSHAPEEVRLSLLALLTHNHYVEVNLFKIVALTEGVEKAWKVALMINNLYLHEQSFWMNNNSNDVLKIKNPILEKLFGKTYFEPFNRFVQIEAQPVFLINSCIISKPLVGLDLASIRIPAIKSYHFYGAIITASRMKHFNIPLPIAERVNQLFVRQYKTKSGSTDEAEIHYLEQLYQEGTRYAYLCH